MIENKSAAIMAEITKAVIFLLMRKLAPRAADIMPRS